MHFNRVKLPDEIRIALEQERLVIFAGAGVSLPPPSNLPTFKKLASQIAGGGIDATDPLDRFLGKLVRENQTDVHAAATRIVYGNNTTPTLLHREILRLFGTASKVRVVTTNFDDHFSVAARKLYRKDHVREFCAPALPLGDDFAGLVYLHGSARINPAKLVLTDRDFGAAYLTRGWARDFLVSLFSRYTVLFVGYSHNDVTTSYLARGLDSSQIGQRWALTSSDVDARDRENWNHLEISVIEYPKDLNNIENQHQPLTDFFSQWADHTKDSVFVRAKRVKAIARGLPPEGEGDSAYLRYCLSDYQLAKDFCEAIRHPAWVGWMQDQGYFDSLFVDTASKARITLSHKMLDYWLCRDVRRRYPDLLLGLIRAHRQQLRPEFTRIFAHDLWVDHSKNPDPHFATWLAILLSQGSDAVDEGIWSYLLQKCQIPDHIGVALGLFDLLSAPQLKIERDWLTPYTEGIDASKLKTPLKMEYSIQWAQDAGYNLRKTWENVFEPHLREVAEPLAQLIVKQITLAYLLLQGVEKTSVHYDRLSGSRSSIAPHEQDDIREDDSLSCLVDFLRSILDFWIEADAARAKQRAEDWWTTKFPLLMRLAAYARSHDPQYSADERIAWVLDNDLIFRSGMKKEVFDILKSAYSLASQPTRRRLLQRINRGYRERGARRLDRATLDYEQFNVLVWLRRSDPDCSLVNSAIDNIHETHPQFGERENPEFDVWHGKAGFRDPTEGFNIDQILSQRTEDFLGELLSIEGHPLHRDLWSYLQCLPQLFKRDKEWGREFVEALARVTTADDEVWNGVFRGWRDTLEDLSDWKWMLDIIDRLPHNRNIYEGIANLVAHGFQKFRDESNEEMIDRAASLMERTWEICKDENSRPDESYGDWLTTAINHVGGRIGEFWVHYCSHLRQRAGEDWQGIPASLQSKVVEALRGTNRLKVLARIAITPWIGYFFNWDREFTVEHLLPLFDWKRDPIVAQQSWSVLLNYKRGTSKDLENQLIPFYRQCVEQLTGMLKDSAEQSAQFGHESLWHLGHHLAALAIHVISDPVESGLFPDFLPLLPDRVRESLAVGMGSHLESLNDADCKRLWDTWLKRYLDLRLVGVPVALSTTETRHMLEWCLHLGPVFDQVVERLSQMPFKSVEAYSLLRDLAVSPLVDQWPLSACRIAIIAIRNEDYSHLTDFHQTLHSKFESKIRKEPEFATYEELLYRRGWRKE